MRVWRLGRAIHQDDELSGEGARRHGGRWNSRGLACIYTAASLELALLETLVHLDLDLVPADLLAIELELPDPEVASPPAELPPDWHLPPPYLAGTRQMGDAWLKARRSLALAVPSSVLPQRLNVLINPGHPAVSSVRIIDRMPLPWPGRLQAYLASLRSGH